MRVLILGGAGFVGGAIALHLKHRYPNYQITVLDNLRRRGSELNLPRLRRAGVDFQHGDIRNPEDLHFETTFDLLIDASAEPSVLAGITSPVAQVVNNNLLGTVNCLELAKRTGAAFIFLSSSRVYPIEAIEAASYRESETRFVLDEEQVQPGISGRGISEAFALNGSRSFYGATKLASELLIQEYQSFFKLKTVINRCGVITGPWQMGKVDQGVVVLWVAKHFFGGRLTYTGYGGLGKQVRDILHVDDLCRLVDWQMHHIEQINGELFNVGGGVECSVSLSELTGLCEEIVGNKLVIGSDPSTRPADIRMYLTDNAHVTRATGWKPLSTPEAIVTDIRDWIEQNSADLGPILG